jgi:hypothetical protein
MRITLSAELRSSPQRPQKLIACLMVRKRETSPISSAHVSAVIGPTPGIVLSRLILSAKTGSRCNELTREYSVFWQRSIVSRLSFSNGRMLG